LIAVAPIGPGLLSEASDPAPSADEVLARARAVLFPVKDKSMHLLMTVQEPSGVERVRSLRGQERHAPGDRRVLWVFESPAELAGTGFLAQERDGAADALWVYFPGQRRVRQVPPSLRRENFQGSMFTYEDLTALVFLDYGGTHRLVGEQECGKSRCYVIETELPEGAFAYRRLRSSIETETYLPVRVEFHADGLLKEMQVKRTAVVQEIPTILAMEMKSHRDGYRTTVEFTDVVYNQGLDDGLFTVEHLTRIGK
jgi:hypothetical protein